MTVYYNRSRRRWCYDFRKEGRRYAGYCVHPATGKAAGSRREARQIEALIRERTTEAAAPPPPGRVSMAQIFALYIAEAQYQADWDKAQGKVAELLDYFGPETPAADVTEEDVARYIEWSRKRPVRYPGRKRRDGTREMRETGRTRADSTTNRYLACLRRAFSLAHKARDKATRERLVPDPPDIPYLDEPDDLPNPIGEENLRRIFELAPPHLFATMLLSVYLGLRLKEALDLRWRQVRLSERVVVLESKGTKGKRGDAIPFDEFLYQWFCSWREDAREYAELHELASIDDVQVVLYRHKGKGPPRPIATVNSAWRTTLKAAGVRHRYHDTRADFATFLHGLGVNFRTLKDMARHRSISTTLRYIKAADGEKRAAATKMGEAMKVARLPLPGESSKQVSQTQSQSIQKKQSRY